MPKEGVFNRHIRDKKLTIERLHLQTRRLSAMLDGNCYLGSIESYASKYLTDRPNESDTTDDATSIRRTFQTAKNEKLFNASNEFHISDYFHLIIFCGE